MKFRINEDKLTPIDRQFLTMAALQGDAWRINEWEIHTTDMGVLRSERLCYGVPILKMQLMRTGESTRFRRLSWRGGILMQAWHQEKLQSAMPERKEESPQPAVAQAQSLTAAMLQQQMAAQQAALQQRFDALTLGNMQAQIYKDAMAQVRHAQIAAVDPGPGAFAQYGHKLPKDAAETLFKAVEEGKMSAREADQFVQKYVSSR